MANTSPAEFVRQVKQEALKVSWASRKETGISTMMVLALVIVASIFFLVVDSLISWGIQLFLGIGG